MYGDDGGGDDEWALRFVFKVGERVIGGRIKQKNLLGIIIIIIIRVGLGW
jgi:hypothetical protein